jgi:hypothetical protein
MGEYRAAVIVVVSTSLTSLNGALLWRLESNGLKHSR